MMSKLRNSLFMVLSFLLLLSCSSGEPTKKIKIGYTNWADCIAITYLAKSVLVDQGYDVDLLNADVAPIFASLSSKKIDLFLDVWLPVTHNDYMNRYAGKIEMLGTIYDEAYVGLVVPAYVPINTIDELNAHKERFDSKIVGIDAGSGTMKITEEVIAAYGLDFNLLTSSGSAMTASLKRAVDDKKWIVFTGWTPHWMFERYKLKMLKDTKNLYGKAESINAITWTGFQTKDPFAAKLISNIRLNNEEMASLMAVLEVSKMSEEETVKEWMKGRTALIESWIPTTVQGE